MRKWHEVEKTKANHVLKKTLAYQLPRFFAGAVAAKGSRAGVREQLVTGCARPKSMREELIGHRRRSSVTQCEH